MPADLKTKNETHKNGALNLFGSIYAKILLEDISFEFAVSFCMITDFS